MEDDSNKYRGYIITDMELGDSLDNVVFMYYEPLLKLKYQYDMENDEGTDLQS